MSVDDEIDYCIHLASKANPVAYISDPVGTITTNVIGTNNILYALLPQRSLKKIVYASTVEAYGQHNHDDAISEDIFGAIDPQVIRSCYPLSKSCSENLCLSYAEQYGLPVSVTRLAYIYGAGDDIEDPKVITSFMNDIKNGNNIVLKSAGLQGRTYCYVKDAVFGLFIALLNGESKKVYNISSMSNRTTVRDIADKIVELFGDVDQKVELVAASDDDKKQFSLIQNNILDNTAIKKIGYEETVDIIQGLAMTGRYFGLTQRRNR